ncbi:hypothetical protein [Ramlibacter tataouinensis]|uniref:Lipoprotein transmembrane n=1 Tax=Ramlibacter tataouinensis (strain ATCC BAA-407 / DSM 14655 / LMG 21543 / TTB310) TaxID=365046 RepID=F5Y238_RAMTT|nr:hypothetical protein [Ramlibacter tataouinensis]AEG94806.1 Conserved hypothetical protein [Ramlibacter tataouinensis TTB310]
MKFLLSAVLATALLAGCAGNAYNAGRIAPGTPRADVVAQAGQPTAVVPLPGGGERLQYSLQPFGQHAYMVDLDAMGRVTQVRQVLAEREFQRIQPGVWTGIDVQREFGPPARVDAVSSWNGPVLTYRWRDAVNTDMFYHVYLDAQNVVRRAHPAMEFRNVRDERG